MHDMTLVADARISTPPYFYNKRERRTILRSPLRGEPKGEEIMFGLFKKKDVPNNEYSKRLSAIRANYPFSGWAESGLEQYTKKACASFEKIFDNLIDDLAIHGEQASEEAKLAAFQKAVEALNKINEKDASLIETGEREDLCELCNIIAVAAGLDPKKYGDGEGPASTWRDW